MKKIIKMALSLGLLLGIVASNYISFTDKIFNEELKLSMLYSLNQASAEDGTTTKVQCVSCWNEEITLPDGTKTIAHRVGCSGTGELECKCQGHT